MKQPVSCHDVRERLSALIENDLEPQARRAVEEHLLGCPDCRAEQAALDRMLGALNDLPAPEPPADLVARIDTAIDRLPAPRRRPLRSRFTRHAMAALLVVGLVVGMVRVLPRIWGPPLVVRHTTSGVVSSEGRASADRQGLARDAAKEPAAMPPAEKKMRSEPAPAGRAQALVEGEFAGTKEAPPSGDPRALFLSPRAEPAWVDALHGIALARPDALGPAWKSLDDRRRGRVLEAWRRAAAKPGLRADLEAALRRAHDPAAVAALRALLEYTP